MKCTLYRCTIVGEIKTVDTNGKIMVILLHNNKGGTNTATSVWCLFIIIANWHITWLMMTECNFDWAVIFNWFLYLLKFKIVVACVYFDSCFYYNCTMKKKNIFIMHTNKHRHRDITNARHNRNFISAGSPQAGDINTGNTYRISARVSRRTKLIPKFENQ